MIPQHPLQERDCKYNPIAIINAIPDTSFDPNVCIITASTVASQILPSQQKLESYSWTPTAHFTDEFARYIVAKSFRIIYSPIEECNHFSEINDSNIGPSYYSSITSHGINYLNDYRLLPQLKILDDIKSLGNNWDDEYHTPGPTKEVLELSNKVIVELYNRNITPYRISPISEEGICLFFYNNSKKMYLEIYNDGGVGYIIEDTTNNILLDNSDIPQSNIIDAVIHFFSM